MTSLGSSSQGGKKPSLPPNSPPALTVNCNPFRLVSHPFAHSSILLTLLLWPDQWTIAWLCAESPVSANVVLVSLSSSIRKRVALSGSRAPVPGPCCPPSLSMSRRLRLAPSPGSVFSGSAPLRFLRPERAAVATDTLLPPARSRKSARSPGATVNRGLMKRGGGVAGARPSGPE